VSDRWTEMLGLLRERAYGIIDCDPSVLLSGPGGSGGVEAHAIYARLFGFDDEVVADWRIKREEPVLLMPIAERLTIAQFNEPSTSPSMRTARYVCWSGHATMSVSAMYLPSDIQYDFTTCQATLLFLRYKREAVKP